MLLPIICSFRAVRRNRSDRGYAAIVPTPSDEPVRYTETRALPQTDLRLTGQRTIPDRTISLVDHDARPVRQGNPGRPTEFGYKAVVADTAEGFVIADVPTPGAAVDGGLLEDAIVKATNSGM